MRAPSLPLLALGCTLAFAPALPAQAKAQKPGKVKAALSPEVARGEVLARAVRAFYTKAKDFSAAFAQTYDYTAFGRVEERAGKVQVKRPGLVRWEYTSPEKKLLILDGKNFWQWIPEDNTALVKRGLTGNEASAAFSFLWGKGDLLAEFSARSVPLPDELKSLEASALLLEPKKPGGSVQQVIFAVAKDGSVRASVLTDAQGNKNRLVFTEVKLNQKLGDALFVFEPPKGATVQELP